jgi:hypothetical protein
MINVYFIIPLGEGTISSLEGGKMGVHNTIYMRRSDIDGGNRRQVDSLLTILS